MKHAYGLQIPETLGEANLQFLGDALLATTDDVCAALSGSSSAR